MTPNAVRLLLQRLGAVNGIIGFIIVKAVQNFRKGRKEKSSEG